MTTDFSTFGLKTALLNWTVFSTYPSMFSLASFKLSAMTNPVTTISNSQWTAGHFLDSSRGDGFLSVVVFHLVGNRPPTFITPLASLPLIIYGRLAFQSSLYIDDRHSSQLSFPNGCLPVAYQNLPSQDSINLALANAAIFLTCFILSSLGYFIGLDKSTLVPCK